MLKVVKKLALIIFLLAGGILWFVNSRPARAGYASTTTLPATLAVDMSTSSPQYLTGLDLSPLLTVDNSTITSGLLNATVNTGQANMIFKFNTGYTLPPNESFNSLTLHLVYKMNVGTLGSQYVIVKYFNKNGVRTTCVSQTNLPIPAAAGTYATQDVDIMSCQDQGSLQTIEVYYFASGSTLPVNTSFDQVAIEVSHGQNNSSSGGSGSSSSSSTGSNSTSNFQKSVDAGRAGGSVDRGPVKLIFGRNALPYEANIGADIATSPLIKWPAGRVGNGYKLDVFSSFNGYPLVKFNPALIFLTFPGCSGRPVVQTSRNGTTWQALFTVRAASPANTVAAVITSPGYYAVTCR